jgi:hypothetical protein
MMFVWSFTKLHHFVVIHRQAWTIFVSDRLLKYSPEDTSQHHLFVGTSHYACTILHKMGL